MALPLLFGWLAMEAKARELEILVDMYCKKDKETCKEADNGENKYKHDNKDDPEHNNKKRPE